MATVKTESSNKVVYSYGNWKLHHKPISVSKWFFQEGLTVDIGCWHNFLTHDINKSFPTRYYMDQCHWKYKSFNLNAILKDIYFIERI